MQPAKNSKMADQNEPVWFLYMIRCRNGNIYTGISTDVERRLTQHQSGKGAKSLRGKGPLKLVYQKQIGSRSDALKAESAIKKLSKTEKEKLLQQS